MKTTSIILQRDFREMRQTSAFRIVVIAAAVLAVAAAVALSIILSGQVWVGEEATVPLLELIVSLVTYFVPLLVLMAFIWAFASLPIVKEKINGNIECLLATPISPRELWIGKSLAIFLPGFGLSVVATLLVVIVINMAVIKPEYGYFIMPAPALLTGFIINPLLLFALLAFIILFSLVDNPDIAIAPSFLIGFGLMMGLPIGIATRAINMASWSFALWYLAGTIVSWLIVLSLTRLLTVEKIVLSSRGS